MFAHFSYWAVQNFVPNDAIYYSLLFNGTKECNMCNQEMCQVMFFLLMARSKEVYEAGAV